jgi:integrase
LNTVFSQQKWFHPAVTGWNRVHLLLEREGEPMAVKSSTKRTARKSRQPAKFPLGRHPKGYWCKRIKNKLHYFGKIADDPDGAEALERYLATKDDLIAGRKPRDHKSGGLTVADAANHFLNGKRLAMEAGEITKRTHDEYKGTCKRLIRVFDDNRLVDDLRPDDFEELRADIASTWGAYRTGSEIQRVRSIFKWLFESEMIPKPMNFGPSFKKPSKRIMRVQKASKPLKLFAPSEIHKLLDAADPQMRCMILLGLNLGYGNHDCGGLTLDLATEAITTGILNWPRPKTGVPRRGILWPETITALKEAMAIRPAPKTPEAQDKLFVVATTGKPWTDGNSTCNTVSTKFNELQDACGVRVRGRGFYALRHTFETISGELCDQVATDLVMGHLDASMAANYRQRIDDSRIQRITDHVRSWLYGTQTSDDDDRTENTTEAIEGQESGDMDAGGPVLLSFCLTYAA